ncbi:MAG: hypothetical protein WA659_01560 [Candidatus Aquirickettsiella sp.]
MNPNTDKSFHCPTHATFFIMLKLLLQLQACNRRSLAASAELEKNEAFLDEIFLHGKYANFQDGNFNYLQISNPEFTHWKAYLADIANKEKIKFFSQLLLTEKISLTYYKIQTGRYQIKTLKKCCFFTLAKNVHIQQIDQLSLPKPLKENLTAFAEQQGNNAHLELCSLRMSSSARIH